MNQEYLSKLGEIINRISPVSPSTVSLIASLGSFQSCQKNEVIFSEKKYNAFEYFQVEGITHRYNTGENGEQITTGIYTGGTVITPNLARTINGQSLFSLQALTSCTCLKIPAGAFDEIRRSHDQVWALGQLVVEREFRQHLQYEVLFRSGNAKDRLLYFRSNFRQLENLISHAVIASFLGITPVSFSRLRNELSKEGD